MKTQEIKISISNWITNMSRGYRQPDSLFLNYNFNEQKECINLIRRRQINPLYFALSYRHSLDIIKIFVFFDEESLKNTKEIFYSYSFGSEILYYIPQKEVLSYLISIFKEKKIPYDPINLKQ